MSYRRWHLSYTAQVFDLRIPLLWQTQATVLQRSRQEPMGPHGAMSDTVFSGAEHGLRPDLPQVGSTSQECRGLLKFRALPFTETLCTQPTKSSE